MNKLLYKAGQAWAFPDLDRSALYFQRQDRSRKYFTVLGPVEAVTKSQPSTSTLPPPRQSARMFSRYSVVCRPQRRSCALSLVKRMCLPV